MANQQYEMMVIIKPDLTQKATKAALEAVRSHMTGLGAEIQHEDIWEKRPTSYKMKGYFEGYYAVFYFTMEQDKIDELEKELDLEQDLIRRMILKFPKDLTVKQYLDGEKVVTKRLEEEEEERRKAREEMEKKKRARTEKREAKKDAKNEKKEKKEDDKSIDEQVDEVLDL